MMKLDMKILQQLSMKIKKQTEESIKMIKSQRSDTEKNNLNEEGKRINTDKIVKRNQIINNNLKSQVQNNPIKLFKMLKNKQTNKQTNKKKKKKQKT